MTGIYYIRNKINDKMYIGQSTNIDARWSHHKTDLRNNNHHNHHLQYAWNKYGEDNFEFNVIQECNIDELDNKEMYYIKKYKTFTDGYNLDQGGAGIRGYKHTEEEIAKMRLIQNPEPILQIDLEGNIVREWVSCGEAADTLGFKSASGIKRCCNNDLYKTSNGFIWIYKKDLSNFKLEDHFNNYEIMRPVTSYELNGKTYIKKYNSMKEAIKDTGIGQSEISQVCNGKRNKAGEMIWKYTDKPELYDIGLEERKKRLKEKHDKKRKKILQYDLNGNFIKLWLNSELRESEEFDIRNIQYACNGHCKTSNGFIWKYQEDI